MGSPKDNDDFHHKTATFLDWFKQLKGAYLSPKIEVTDLRDHGAGRGIGMYCTIYTIQSAVALPPPSPPSLRSFVLIGKTISRYRSHRGK